MAETILVVEDELALQETLVYNLEKSGYVVAVAGDGISALDLAHRLNPDLILLDLMLPKLDGFEVCKTLRKESTVPILMLTARDGEDDRVAGLEMGADDYQTKPFSMRELITRVKGLLRRNQNLGKELENVDSGDAAHPDRLVFGNLIINRTRREVSVDGRVISLKPQAYNLLVFFGEHKGQMLSREFILEHVWDWDHIVDSRTVDVHVRWIRQIIERDQTQPKRIVTVRGGGYRFEG